MCFLSVCTMSTKIYYMYSNSRILQLVQVDGQGKDGTGQARARV